MTEEDVKAELSRLASEHDELWTRLLKGHDRNIDLLEKVAKHQRELTTLVHLMHQALMAQEKLLFPEKFAEGNVPAIYAAMERSIKLLN